MRYNFKSGFAERLENFVEQKKALGRSYRCMDKYIARFDNMCYEHYPVATELTREISMRWAVKNPSECNTTFRNRMSPVREFARFLIRNGEDAYVIPTDLVKKSPRHIPYIYTKSEISAIWNAFDMLPPVPNSQSRHLVLAAIVRLLYCCGLRPIEARRLKITDVDLCEGRLYVRESKGHKDRIVMMASDVAEYIRDYNLKIGCFFQNREYFFPSPCGVFSDNSWLNRAWDTVRTGLNFTTVCDKPPRLYDLRHTFATHRLYEWMHEGVDLDAMLPYLSTYMGHAQLSDTYYYIHLVPGQFEMMSGLDLSRYEILLPEVECDE